MRKKRDRKNSPFFERIRFKYRISVLDENTLEESRHMRLSRLTIYVYLCIFFIITFLIFAVLIYTTPLRFYLPGYGDEGNRELVIAESMRADSLQKQMDIQMAYLNVIKEAISGDLKPEEITPLDSFIILDKKNGLSLDKSDRERDFVQRFEEEEKYNLSIIDPRSNENAYVFFRPTRGVIENRFNPFEKFYGISIITSSNENVLSVLDGTVIHADYSFINGWVIQVQHEGNYISIYKNNTRLLKRVGDIVYAGEIIAVTGSPNGSEENFYFELWNNGNAVNPEDVIIF